MSGPIIEVVVTAQGETHVQTKGFAGTACRSASQFLEAALGIPAIERLTAEFYQHEPLPQRVPQRGAS